jgi:hypothetical protein
MASQTQRYDDLTLGEKMKIVQYLAIFPAITIMVFIRRKIGFRMLKPSRLIGMAFFLWFINGITSMIPFGQPAGFIFQEFPWVMLAFAFLQRQLRWRELCKGIQWHTLSPGISYLEFLPLPSALRAHRRIYRFLDPAACFIFSMFFGIFFSQALARWIAFSSVALFIYEQTLFEKQLDRDLDILDGLVAADVQTETVKHFTGPQSEEDHRTLSDTAGIPTGVAFDIHRQIELLRVKRRAEDEKSTAEALLRQVAQVKMAAGVMPIDITPATAQLPATAPDNIAAETIDLPPSSKPSAPDNMVKDASEVS